MEKIESGRHTPDRQTLELIAKASGFDARVFRKPTAEEEAAFKAEAEFAKAKTDMLPISPINSPADVLNVLNRSAAIRFDPSEIEDNEALQLAAEMQDWVEDVMLAWSEIPATDRLELARSFGDYCNRMRELGFICFGGRHNEKLYESTVGVRIFCLIPASRERDTKYALIHMGGAWSKA